MNIRKLHDWNIDYEAARLLQLDFSSRIIFREIGDVKYVAGVDCSTEKKSTQIWAAVVVYDLLNHKVIEESTFRTETNFPYIPGLLSFREGPAVLEAIRRLSVEPDIFIFDGHGIAHPRNFGIASHIGLWLEKPAIGCAKSRLVGSAIQPAKAAGSMESLFFNEREVGLLLRTKDNVKPLWISPGHLVNIRDSADIVLKCCLRHRMPEPTRLAHIAVNRFRTSLSL
ncbi:MAG: endonuclease V [Candidatus Riflebacteria bacterium]|nr:endonuclease V [Candidatus Riflebacteria bacterium]